MRLNNYWIALLMLFMASCSVGGEENVGMEDTLLHIENFHEPDRAMLGNKRIFFGHQSVGMSILDGIDELQKLYGSNYVKIVETRDCSDLIQPAIGHFKVGKILYPKSKIDDFVNIIDNGIGDCVDVAFMKIGFPDINKHTDVEDLFNYYRRSMDSIKEKYDNLRLIHCTVSLTTKPSGIKGIAKRVLKMDNNVYRNEFNELMRSYYEGNEIFDIAKIQSTSPDGIRYSYRKNIPGMVPEYSSDGGHLSKKGKLVLASELINVLLNCN